MYAYRRCADDHNLQAMAMLLYDLSVRGFVHRGCPEARWVDGGYASSSLGPVRVVLMSTQLRFPEETNAKE